MGKLRVGIVGAGNIAQSAHLPVYQRITDIAEVVAIADLNLARAQEAAAKFGIPAAYSSAEELLEKADVDYIDVCVWNGYHADVTIAAANAGKHVLCEKPMAFNVEHAMRMKEAVERNKVQFMLAVPNRYRPDVQLLREMVDAGKIGEIYYAKTANLRRRGTPIGWFTDVSKAGGGPVIDIGVHCIDRTWFLMGCPKPTRISASISYAIGD
ncbi:MAG: Gfo/Idh/MocA family oxidoreductase, partial [Clostridiales bacterium]|nr:Gfo/Idh/MocA family oxidoreductase [Clostridiales bacterium]